MRWLVPLLLAGAVACDGENDSNAPAQCERFLQVLCEHDVTCGGDTVEACKAAVIADPAFPDSGCKTAKRIRDQGELEDCLQTIPTLACDATTPDTCSGQIIFP